MKLKQVIVLRKDLNMRKGKMIAQGAHASRGACKLADQEDVLLWESQGQTKIVVGVESGEELIKLFESLDSSEIPVWLVKDLGKTEIDSGTPTAIGVGPYQSKKIDSFTGNLNLL